MEETSIHVSMITIAKTIIIIIVSLIKEDLKAALNREHDWYTSFLTSRGHKIYPLVVILFFLGFYRPLNIFKVSQQGFTT
jgi:hypothetical protein